MHVNFNFNLQARKTFKQSLFIYERTNFKLSDITHKTSGSTLPREVKSLYLINTLLEK